LSSLNKIFTSSFLLSFEAVLRKLVGLVSTLVLARLLVPEDFGLIAIALMVMGLIDAMKQFGGGTYLLKSERIDTDMINTSWTISFLANLLMALVLILATPYIAEYYTDDRLKGVLWAFSGIWLVRSLGNPALVMLRREQNYLPIVKLSIFTKVIAVIVVIISAIIFESYWALVLGQLTTYTLMTIGSYFLYHHKLKFCLNNFKEQWQFSSWWTLQSLVGFFQTQLDTFLVSSMYDKSALGSYHTIKYFASMPITFFLQPASEPLFVELRKIKDNKEYFNQQFNVSFLVTLLVAAPLALFLMQEHYLVTATLLGDNWTEYSGLFAIFCISIITYTLQRQALDTMVILGSTKGLFYFQILSFVTVYGILLYRNATTIMEFSTIKVGLEISIAALLFIYITLKYTSLRSIIHLVIASTPIIISLLICHYLNLKIDTEYPVFIQLVIAGLLFFTTYLVSLLFFCFLLRKSSPEWRYIWNLAERVVLNLTTKIRKTA